MALVSGANRGIGAEIALELARDHGYRVYAGARNPDQVEPAEGIEPIQLDVTDEDTIFAARKRVESDSGRLDALVNNAGVYGDPTGAAGYDIDGAHDVLEVNTFGPWRLIEAFLPLLRESDDAAHRERVERGGTAIRHERGPRGLPDLEGRTQRPHPNACLR